LIEEKMTIAALSNHDDYRYLQGKSQSQFYYFPLGEQADKFITKTLKSLGVNAQPTKETLIVQGRQIVFDAYNNKIGIFTFNKLCETMLGAADYLALARRLDIIILTAIPKLTPEQRNEAKRFSTLIDTLYEHKVKLICTASVTAEQLYQEGDGAFEFQRTVSRLIEMQSESYNT
jgi:cell division protein ZapE